MRGTPIERNPIPDRLTRTLATKAGLAAKRISFLGIFMARHPATRFTVVRSSGVAYHEPVAGLRWAA